MVKSYTKREKKMHQTETICNKDIARLHVYCQQTTKKKITSQKSVNKSAIKIAKRKMGEHLNKFINHVAKS